MQFRNVLTLAALACVSAVPIAAEGATALPPPPSTTDAETAVVQYVVSDSVSEIALCKLALQTSQNAAVRSFAQTMIDDHGRILDGAEALGKARAMTISIKGTEDGDVSYVHLTKYHGKTFDENFMNQNVMDHTNDIEVLRHASEITTTPDVLAFETATLSTYERHLDLANRAEDREAREE